MDPFNDNRRNNNDHRQPPIELSTILNDNSINYLPNNNGVQPQQQPQSNSNYHFHYHNHHVNQLPQQQQQRQSPQVFIIQQQQMNNEQSTIPMSTAYANKQKFTSNLFGKIIISILAIIIAMIVLRSLYKSFSCPNINQYRYRSSSTNSHVVHDIFRIVENRRYLIEDSVKQMNNKNAQQQQAQSQSSYWFWCTPPLQNYKLQANPYEAASKSISLKNLNEIYINDLLNSNKSDENYICEKDNYNNYNHSEHIKQICTKYNLEDHILSPWHSKIYENCDTTRECPLAIDYNRKIIACLVPSVFERELFRKLSDKNDNQDNNNANKDGNQLLISTIKQSKLVNSSTYVRMMVVRHPFVRLVDAFRKRFEISKFDGQPSSLDNNNRNIINNETTIHEWTFEEWCEESLLPVDPYHYDPLWSPIWMQCEPCYISYNIIEKYETKNFESIINQLNETLFNYTYNHNNTNTNHNTNNNDCDSKQQLKSIYSLTRDYMKRLKPKTILSLYAKYFLDFELFNYTIDEIFLA